MMVFLAGPTDVGSGGCANLPCVGPTADVESTSVTEFNRLDPRVVSLWRVQAAISWATLLLLIGIPAGIGFLLMEFPAARPLVAIAYGMLVLIAIFFVVVIPSRRYRYWLWRVDGRVIEIRRGRLFRAAHLIPLSRLQHVDLQSDPIERMFGLSTLVLHTAGTHQASLSLSGLATGDAEALRDRLVVLGEDDAV